MKIAQTFQLTFCRLKKSQKRLQFCPNFISNTDIMEFLFYTVALTWVKSCGFHPFLLQCCKISSVTTATSNSKIVNVVFWWLVCLCFYCLLLCFDLLLLFCFVLNKAHNSQTRRSGAWILPVPIEPLMMYWNPSLVRRQEFKNIYFMKSGMNFLRCLGWIL